MGDLNKQQGLQHSVFILSCVRLHDKSTSAPLQRSTDRQWKGEAQITHHWDAPRAITGESPAHQRPTFASPEEQRGTVAGRMPNQGWRGTHPVQLPPRAVPGQLQPHCPGMKPIQMSHWEQQFGSLFRIRGCCFPGVWDTLQEGCSEDCFGTSQSKSKHSKLS